MPAGTTHWCATSSRLVARAISKDAGEFATKHPAFVFVPQYECAHAMALTKMSNELAGQYERFIEDMVYAPADQVAGYLRAAQTFESMLELVPGRLLIASCSARPALKNEVVPIMDEG